MKLTHTGSAIYLYIIKRVRQPIKYLLQVWAWVFLAVLWRRPSPQQLLVFFFVGWCWARVWCEYWTLPSRHPGPQWRPWCEPGSRWPCGMLYHLVRFSLALSVITVSHVSEILKVPAHGPYAVRHHMGAYHRSHGCIYCSYNNEACMTPCMKVRTAHGAPILWCVIKHANGWYHLIRS